ncbi:sec-independent protein translocase protein TatA [Corynebacterium mucifaciens]|uniref:Sec-independent protein translocase subunit TatA n=1 Tax=Corynebacterium ureicelerivorans TaxID=401472 RepID=UPI002355CF51|nr:Sec-independent protein translocase subunit TatA [Corynebacterium ureicelerivorans]MCT1370288.1 Sec-independent protein translocase subunit TatA [Corynebacterium mucifaciens]MDN8625704.1 Sec-independent protein translocase subunit TatA [Corynebacterium ureicelerivorans]
MPNIGWTELIVILFVVLLLFGANKLPDLARSMGRSARIFKSEVKEMREEDEAGTATQQRQIESAPAQETRSATQEADFWDRPENQPR